MYQAELYGKWLKAAQLQAGGKGEVQGLPCIVPAAV
jgi:hypothetical protein